MHRARLFAAFALVLLALATSPVAADPDGWVRLGRVAVTDRIDRDVIELGAKRGDFEAIRIEVKRKAVDFHRVEVRFMNGDKQEIELREKIPAGGSSRVIDLEGGDRVVESILLVYDAKSLGGRAVVTVLGRR